MGAIHPGNRFPKVCTMKGTSKEALLYATNVTEDLLPGTIGGAHGCDDVEVKGDSLRRLARLNIECSVQECHPLSTFLDTTNSIDIPRISSCLAPSAAYTAS